MVLKQAVVLANLIIDTGCTEHIITQKELFENLQPCSIKNVKDPKGNLTPVERIGDVPVKLHLKNGRGRNGSTKCS